MTTRSGRNPLPNYRSPDPNREVWWQRSRDPVGLHTFLAFILGIALIAFVGVRFDPLGVTTEFDLPQVEQDAFDESYATALEAGRQTGRDQGKRGALIEIALRGQGGSSEWVMGVVEGWREGWNDALEALEAATADHVPDEERERELNLLEEIARR